MTQIEEDNMQWNKIIDSLNDMMESSYKFSRKVDTVKEERDLMTILMFRELIGNCIAQWLQLTYNTKVEKKDLQKSTSYKSRGNVQFKFKNYATSLESYTQSAIFAPSHSVELPIAIGNKSAALYHLNSWKDCIRNIKLALKLEYPAHLRHKLIIREAQCYLKLGQKQLAIDAIVKAHILLNGIEPSIIKEQLQKKLCELRSKASRLKDNTNTEYTEHTTISENLATIANPGISEFWTSIADSLTFTSEPQVSFGINPNFRCASAAIDLRYKPEIGRHVVANRDIEKGRILFVETAFTFVPLNQDESTQLCHNCCNTINRDICAPCPTCVDVLYCSVACWEKARLYHNWECPGYQMNIWSQIGIGHLALKMLFASVLTNDLERFNEVQELQTNFTKLERRDIISYGLTATMLTYYLLNYTNFFETVDIEEQLALKFSRKRELHNYDFTKSDDKRLFVSILLLKYILQLVANGHAITKINAIMIPESRMRILQQDKIATGIFPSASMMNHSCNANIVNSFMGDVLIVKAIRDIKKGQEVLNCYGPDFRTMTAADRQELLESQYCFDCCCEMCTDPHYCYFAEMFSAIKCPACKKGPLIDTCKKKSLIVTHKKEPLIDTTQFLCMDCGKGMNKVTLPVSLKEAKTFFDEAIHFVKNEQYQEALKKLLRCLALRRESLYEFHDDITITIDFIGKIYAGLEQWWNCIRYIEYSLPAIEEKYGSMSVETCYELNKLTDICIIYLQNESKTQTKFYKNILKKTRRYLNRTEEIVDMAYGPWNNLYIETTMKKDILNSILQHYNL